VKIAIVTYDEYINIPYIQKYEKLIINSGHTYDVILWDRRGICNNYPDNHLLFGAKVNKSKSSKIIPFFKWRKFTLNILQRGQYDKLIILTTMPAVLIFDFLIKHYAGRFFFDFRDFTYENFWIYKQIVKKIVEKSAYTSISSQAFNRFLPKTTKILVTHNLSNSEAVEEHVSIDLASDKIIIGFVGGIRYYAENCKLLMKLKNKSHFKLSYVGKSHPGCDLQAFCKQNGIHNVSFSPEFDNSQKPDIYRRIDLINSIYGNKTNEVSLALPNKLYDCILFKKPIIVSNNTYLANLVEKYCLGLIVDIDYDDIEKKIENYLSAFDAQQFENGCREYLELVRKEEDLVAKGIVDFLQKREYYEFNEKGGCFL